jgi:HEAT repeat protein
MLADRREPKALPAAVSLLNDGDPGVSSAALEIVGSVGDPATAVSLAQRTAGDEGEQAQAIRAAVARMPGDDVDTALAQALQTADTGLAIALIRILGERRSSSAVPILVAKAREPNRDTRREALTALGASAGEGDLPTLLGLVREFTDGDEANAAMAAVVAAAGRSKDASRTVDGLLAALTGKTPTSARCALIRVLPRFPDARILEMLTKAVHDPSPEIQDDAVRSLAEWPSVDALPLLLDLARNAERFSHRILSFRGYVNLVDNAADWPPPRKLEALKEAWALAPRVEEKRVVIGALANLGTREALSAVEASLSDPELSREAVAAILRLSAQVAPQDPQYVRSVLEKAAQSATDSESRQEVLDLMGRLAQPPPSSPPS